MKPSLIETSSQLEELCAEFINEPLLAIDTEFFRETTYFPHLGLVQLASPTRIVCIDPLAFDAREQLGRLLLNPEITKIFHACTQDLEVLFQYLGKIPSRIIDTQIAAAMLGEQEQIGYAALVEQQTGIQLEKSQTRTNWLKRPLTARQIDYAGDDVLYLIPMYHKLMAELKHRHREYWLNEDCDKLSNDAERFVPDMINCWKRVKGYNRLRGIQLYICYAVAQWREQLAIKKDLTRRKALSDDAVIQIATRQSGTEQALAQIAAVRRSLNSDEISSLSEIVSRALDAPESEWPQLDQNKPSAQEKELLNQCLKLLRNRTSELGIAQGLLCSRKDLEKMIRGERELAVLQGWRRDCIGEELLRMMAD